MCIRDRIYNTLTRRKEELQTITPGKVKIYSCGPTVYNLIHIGNARPICVFDTLRRYLVYRGYEVDFVQNYTDVDLSLIHISLGVDIDSLLVSQPDTGEQALEIMEALIPVSYTHLSRGNGSI